MYDTYTSTAAPPADDGMTESASARGSRPVSVVESSIPRKSEEESDGMSRVTGMLRGIDSEFMLVSYDIQLF